MNIVVLITILLAYMLMENVSGKVGDIYVEITTSTQVYKALFAVTFEKKRSGYQLKLESVRDNGKTIFYVEKENFSKYDDVRATFFVAGEDPIIDYKTHVVISQNVTDEYYDQRYNNFNKEAEVPTVELPVYYYIVDELDAYRSEFSYYTMDKSIGLLTSANKTGYICNIDGTFTVVTYIGNFIITDVNAFISGAEYVSINSGIYRLKRSTAIPMSGTIIFPK